MNSRKAAGLILFVIAVSAFTLSYYKNYWGVVSTERFTSFDVYCESQVIGRVIRSETKGIFSEGGLNGWVRDDSVMKDFTWEQMTYYQFDIYRDGKKIGPANFVIYDSQMGGQGMTYALIDKISPFRNSKNLKIFWLLNSLLTALLFTLFVSWVNSYYGFTASVFTFLMILCTPWLTLFGRDLYIVLAFFYFPFIVLLCLLHFESGGKVRITLARLFLVSAAVVFIKLFFSGFEFITSALVMLTIPLFFYLVLDRWKILSLVRRFFTIVAGAVTAIVTYAILFSWQLSFLKGGMAGGFRYMLYCFLKRTHGNSADFPETFKESLESGIGVVLNFYLNAKALDFGKGGVSFATLVIIFIAASMLSFVPGSVSPGTYSRRKINLALIITTWISLLAPMSWFVVFKAHAYIHSNFDEIVWYMPFCLFGFALTGSVGLPLIRDVYIYLEKMYRVKSEASQQ